MGKTILITGGYGFIGSNLINFLITEQPDIRIINVDANTYAADPKRVPSLINLKNIEMRVEDPAFKDVVKEYNPDIVLHLAAESHVDRSINSAKEFYTSNVLGTLNVCESLVGSDTKLVHVSTDEVYGHIPLGDKDSVFEVKTPLAPNSPYAASKAASDLVVRSFINTHNINAVITRCSNNYGPGQHWEKFIPNSIKCALDGLPIPVYGSGQNERDWVHVNDHCRGIWMAASGESGDIFHFGTGKSVPNIDIARAIAIELNAPIKFVEDRKGHDQVYRMSWNSSVDMGWSPTKKDIVKEIPELIKYYKKKYHSS
jgi:dTDP-glucose 4,6-dehydratase